MRRVALTGGIATGKSHVRAQFEALGAATIDADVLARDAVAPGTPGLRAVLSRFGPDVLDASAGLDRRKLGAIVFSDPGARRDLEAIVHPEVRRATNAWFASRNPAAHRFAVADVPLLYETGLDRDFDLVIVTACEPAAQLQRLMARDGLTDAEARQRIAAQLPLDEKIRRADYVIRTDGTRDATSAEVRRVVSQLVRDA
jgi:dephospho-CoA kinase